MVDNTEFQERIYDLANGFWDFVKNEFTEGSFCAESYAKVLDAYERLCSRLHSETSEDADVEIIINEMHEIMRHISLKMFQYGVFFARREASV